MKPETGKNGTQVNGNEDLMVGVILDRSGSMAGVRDDTIGAFNTLIEDLALQQGQTFLTLTQFDTSAIEVVVDACPIALVPKLDRASYIPRSGTPLLDAVGITLTNMDRRIQKHGWQGKVLVAIMTDGFENASREWTFATVLELITELEQKNWAFSYLGASPAAIEEAVKMGISRDSSAVWRARGKNVGAAGKSMAGQADRWRKGTADSRSMVADLERAQMLED